MGIPVLILGESGSGKTYSLKHFNPEEIGIFSVEKGRLPFKNNFKIVKNANYQHIAKVFQKPSRKAYVIDDSQYLMVNEFFDKASDTGYTKYTEIGLHFRNLIKYINSQMPDDVIVYFLHHTETDPNTGKTKAKTVGKMLDNYLTIEGCFDIVLQAKVEGQEHFFLTQSDGYATLKSPEEMFEPKIPNDLKAVDTIIREYYGLDETNNNESEE